MIYFEKSIHIILILLFHLSCAQRPINPSYSHVDRDIASITSDCVDILHNLFDHNLLKIKNMASFNSLKLFDQVNITSPYVRDSIFESEISKEMSLEVHLRKILKYKIIGKVKLNELYEKALVMRAKDISSLYEFKTFMTKLEKFKWPIKNKVGLLEKTFVYREKYILSIENNDFSVEALEALLTKGLLKKAENSYLEDEFFNLLSIISESNLSGTELYAILKSSPFYNNIIQANPILFQTIDDLFHDKVRLESRFLFKEIKTAIKLEVDPYYIPKAVEINSSYVFFQTLKKFSENKKVLKILENSPYAYKMDINIGDLKKTIESKGSFDEVVLEIFPTFKGSKKLYSLNRFDNEIFIDNVYDQCGWGSCWLQTNMKKSEITILNKGEKVSLSTDYGYLRFLETMYKSHMLTDSFEQKPLDYYIFGEGGTTVMYQHLVSRWGLIPESAWRSKSKLHSNNNEKFHSDVLRLMFDLKKDLLNVKGFLKKTKKRNKMKIQKLYLNKIDLLFEDYYGKIPRKFLYKGKEYTPQSFANKFNPEIQDKVLYTNYENISSKFEADINLEFKEVLKGNLQKTNLKVLKSFKSSDEIDKIIIDSIDANRPVSIAVKWKSGELFVNKNNEVLPYIDDISGNILAPKNDKNSYYSNGGHAVLIIGYELDKWGKVKTLKILNSWGEHSGDRGIYNMDINYFKQYLINMDVKELDGLAFIKELVLKTS